MCDIECNVCHSVVEGSVFHVGCGDAACPWRPKQDGDEPTIAVPVHEWARMRYKAQLLDEMLNGQRELPFAAPYDDLGVAVRDAWVTWASSQPNPKQSWLAPYEDLDECDKQADRMIGMQVARWTLIMDAVRLSARLDPPKREQ